MLGLSLVTLNIELDVHFPEVIAFLTARKPDVVLLQEVYKKDVSFLEHALTMYGIYSGDAFLLENGLLQELGIMVCSRLPIVNSSIYYYSGEKSKLPTILRTEGYKSARSIIQVEVVKNDEKYCLANTHFTWSAHGKPSKQQHTDCQRMLDWLSQFPELILCGDFNAPRGTDIFSTMATKYTDNIPQEVQTTLDKKYHRAGELNLVVDGLFTSQGYRASDVEIINGLSDHCAIVGTVFPSP